MMDDVKALVEQVRPIFAGHTPEVVGAALADLTATLFAGLFADTPQNTQEMREELLKLHIDTVRRLIPVNEVSILESHRKAMQ